MCTRPSVHNVNSAARNVNSVSSCVNSVFTLRIKKFQFASLHHVVI